MKPDPKALDKIAQQHHDADIYKKWANTYETDLESIGCDSANHMAQLIGEHLDQQGDQNSRELKLLDVGCGTGLVAQTLKTNHPNISIIGCDITFEMMEIAKNKNFYSELIYADAQKVLPFPDNSFDLVYACGLIVIEYINRKQVIKEMCRVLKTSGYLVFNAPKDLLISSFKNLGGTFLLQKSVDVCFPLMNNISSTYALYKMMDKPFTSRPSILADSVQLSKIKLAARIKYLTFQLSSNNFAYNDKPPAEDSFNESITTPAPSTHKISLTDLDVHGLLTILETSAKMLKVTNMNRMYAKLCPNVTQDYFFDEMTRRQQSIAMDWLLSPSLDVISILCPDYSYQNGMYTFDSLWSGIGLVAQRLIDQIETVYDFCSSSGKKISLTFLLADYEVDDIDVLKLLNETPLSFLSAIRGSIDAVKKAIPPRLKTCTTITTFTSFVGIQNFEDVLKNQLHRTINEMDAEAVFKKRRPFLERWFQNKNEHHIRKKMLLQGYYAQTVYASLAAKFTYPPLIVSTYSDAMHPFYRFGFDLPTLYIGKSDSY